MNKDWQRSAVVYQVYPRSFLDTDGDGVGDLRGIVQKLPYLHKLGVDVLWLNPIFASPNDDNGYDISDYRKIMPEFGTMADFEELLREMHARGMKLMLDLVVNHTSDEHFWFQESRKSRDNPYRDYYIWRPGREGGPPNNWGAVFGGSAWEPDPLTGEYYLHCFSKKQPDLNWENPKVRQEVYSLMRFWCDKGIDGFRMDVINMISKDQRYPDGEKNGWIYGAFGPYVENGPRVHEYLREMNREVLSHYDLITVGETPGVSVEDARKYTGGDELQMVFQFEHVNLDLPSKGQVAEKPLKLSELKEVFRKWQQGLHGEGWNSLYLNNHDQPRMVSRFGDDGEFRVPSAKMLGTCLHMMQGTPYIYQGEELGMTNVPFPTMEDYRDLDTLNLYRELKREGRGTEEELLTYFHRHSRDNARTPMQWDGGVNAGFTTGTPWIKLNPNYPEINAQAALEAPDSIFYYYQKLIRLRKEYPVVVDGDFTLLLPESEELFVYTRRTTDEALLVVCSFAGREAAFTLPEGWERSGLLLSNYPESGDSALRPYEARVYYKKGDRV